MSSSANITTDFLVIGAGIAGLSFALEAAKFGSVTVLAKAGGGDANTSYAQGGIASVWRATRTNTTSGAKAATAIAACCMPRI
jgi:L-aspartate oxidase